METWPIAAKVLVGMVVIPGYFYSLKAISTILLQDKLIYAGYFPPGSRSATCNYQKYQLDKSFHEEFITSCDGRTKLQLWSFRSLKMETRKAPTLLYFQGNAGNLGHRMSHIKMLLESTGANILALHYRGYGKSNGWSSEKGIKKDAQALLDFVDNHDLFQRQKYCAFGHSLGGAVAIDLAARNTEKFSGLIIENSFLSIEDMVNEIYPKWTMYPYLTRFLWNHWNSKETVKNLNSIPVLYIVGDKDEVVPNSHTVKLANDTPCSTVVHFPAGLHDNTWKQRGYSVTISSFIQKCVSIPSIK